jgi:hypothetical protein
MTLPSSKVIQILVQQGAEFEQCSDDFVTGLLSLVSALVRTHQKDAIAFGGNPDCREVHRV